MNSKYVAPVCFIVVSLFLLCCFSCDSKDNYIGKYVSVDKSEPAEKKNIIELMESGEGLWQCCDGDVSFTWYIKGKELRIYTKEGGVMTGKLGKDKVFISLPGDKKLLFRKVLAEN